MRHKSLRNPNLSVSHALLVGRSDAVSRLTEANRRLARRYGSPHLGNKRHVVSELVFIILSARTRGDNHAAIYRRLRRHFGGWENVRDASVSEIERIIRDAGLSRVKAEQIQSLLRKITADWGSLSGRVFRRMETDQIEQYLITLPGVGLKTARCVMLYALDRPVFPVDTHCMRLFQNLGLIAERMRFEYAQDPLQASVPETMRYSLHVNAVAHGRETCVATSPRCCTCPIDVLCVNRRAKS
jgi:endonuclease-3